MDKVTNIGSMELCMSCGLCCSGALFSDATLEDGEEDKAIELGLVPYLNSEGAAAFDLPCKHLCGSLCSIFPNRLEICDEFHCELTTDVDADKVSFEEASEVVISAKEQFTWLKENAKYNFTKDDTTFNLRTYLHSFRKKLLTQLEEEKEISQIDKIYAAKALNYQKLVDTYFKTTNLYIEYGELINDIEF